MSQTLENHVKTKMKFDPDNGLPGPAKPAESLTKALEQTEHVKELVKESAAELSSVNHVITQELRAHKPLPGVASALKKSIAVEEKVQDAAEKLTIVNQALAEVVREREMVNLQLAAAIEQKDGARNAALHDQLTGLPNRVLLQDRLEHGIAHATRRGSTLAVMFLDLDGFKSINDTYGHDAGDIVLQTIARRLQENSRGDDTVSRHGGDEFLYLLTEIQDKKNIAMIAEKVIKLIQAPCKFSLHDLNIEPALGASIGIAIFPTDGTTADALIKSADAAMYRSKKGKTGYSFAS